MLRRVVWLTGLLVFLVGCRPALQQVSEGTEAYSDSVEPTPTIKAAPLPAYLGYIIPEPGSTYTSAEYAVLARGSTVGSTDHDFAGPGICFSMFPEWVMETGDFPTMQQFLTQLSLDIDGRVITEHRTILEYDLFGAEAHDGVTGELLWRTPDGSPFHLCYEVPLQSGLHTAVLRVEKTSGEIAAFTWSFTITDSAP